MGKTVFKIKRLVNTASDKNPPHGKNPLNKGENVTLRKDKIHQYHEENRLCILKPIIDKLVLRFDPLKNMTIGKKKSFRTYVAKHLKTECYTEVTEEENNQKPGRYKNYKGNHWLHCEGINERILVQTRPKKGNLPFFRFDLNPARLGAKGVNLFKKELENLFNIDVYGLGYKDVLAYEKAVQRFDVAVDVLGVDISDLEIIFVKKHGNQKQPVKSVIYHSETKRDQTDYPNALSDSGSNIYVYNKKAEAQDKNKPVLYGGVLHTRYEHRYTDKNKSLAKALNISPGNNPLRKVDLRWVNYKAIKNKDHSHVLFLQYCKARGLSKALEVIPTKDKSDYEDTYHIAMTDIWHPEKMWSHWPNVLKASGLLSE